MAGNAPSSHSALDYIGIAILCKNSKANAAWNFSLLTALTSIFPIGSVIRVKADLLAWQQGQTGYPIVDACMRALHKTGYINFRMRAMLVSFLCHHLNIDWRLGVHHLARLFLDFEPGIHYPQFQMQAGVTGSNAIRIYNPVKQAQDQDPDGRVYSPLRTSIWPKRLLH